MMLSWNHSRECASRRFAVVAAGAPIAPSDPVAAALAGATLVVAADKGADRLMPFMRRPNVLVGDLDSVDPDTVDRLTADGASIVAVDPRKDTTDGELALNEAILRGFDDVVLLGWIGGERADHSLANQLVLAHPAYRHVSLTILDGETRAYLVRDGLDLEGDPADVVSLVPITELVSGVCLEGLAYPLRDGTLHQAQTRGICNQMLSGVARVTIGTGVLLAFHYPAVTETRSP